MKRKIIKINEEKCDGGLCAEACHEGAIGMVDGKAKLLRDDYCDGLGDCLPVCPVDAISFEEREAAAYDEAAVMANKKQRSHNQRGGLPVPGASTALWKRGNLPNVPTVRDPQRPDPLACADQAGAGKRAIFRRSASAHSGRLLCLRFRGFPQKIHGQPYHLDRMP